VHGDVVAGHGIEAMMEIGIRHYDDGQARKYGGDEMSIEGRPSAVLTWKWRDVQHGQNQRGRCSRTDPEGLNEGLGTKISIQCILFTVLFYVIL
jgi:hypothetical protein